MKNLILMIAFLIGGFSVSAQWAEDFDGKTNLDLEAECWELHGTNAFHHNGLSCGLLASTSITATSLAAIATSDSLTLTTPEFVDSGLVFFDYASNNPNTHSWLLVRRLNRAGYVLSSDTLRPDTIVNTMTIDVGPLQRIELTFNWLSFRADDTVFVDDFISTVDVGTCGVFAIETPQHDEPMQPPIVIKPTTEEYLTMIGGYVAEKPVNELFILRRTYSYHNFYDQEYIKQFVIQ